MKYPEPWMWAELETLLPSHANSMAVDIGAHEGEWAVPLSQHYSRVWSFEAQVELARQLANEVPENVQVIAQALADKPGIRLFTHYADTAHFSGEFNAGGIGTNGATGFVSLNCMALDALNLANVGLIKVDVEGMELDVLRGAEWTVTSEHPLLVIEVHTVANGVALQELLWTWNYDVHVVRHPYYQPGTENAERHYWLIGVPQGEEA